MPGASLKGDGGEREKRTTVDRIVGEPAPPEVRAGLEELRTDSLRLMMIAAGVLGCLWYLRTGFVCADALPVVGP